MQIFTSLNYHITNYFAHNKIMYFNYHSKVKNTIENDKVVRIEIVDEYHGISPAMVLYFKKSPPMPIREHKWDDYIKLLEL